MADLNLLISSSEMSTFSEISGRPLTSKSKVSSVLQSPLPPLRLNDIVCVPLDRSVVLNEEVPSCPPW